MPRIKVSDKAYCEVVLQSGDSFEVSETFATVLKRQRDALLTNEPLLVFPTPGGNREAVDPVEIVRVKELFRPQRAVAEKRKEEEAAHEPLERRQRRSRAARR